MPPKKTLTSETPAITLAVIQQLITYGIAAALEAQAATMASASNPNRNTEPTGTPVAKRETIKSSLAVNFSTSMVRKEQLASFAGLNGLNRRFQELAVLCPNMIPNTKKLMEVFISGLPRSIKGNVTASKPQTLEEATNIAQRLMD
ncbi:hypothetical protein Tco_0056354, partial [Tanacetum coccineum]